MINISKTIYSIKHMCTVYYLLDYNYQIYNYKKLNICGTSEYFKFSELKHLILKYYFRSLKFRSKILLYEHKYYNH